MTPLEHLATADWVHVLGWTLLHTLWQGALAALLGAAGLAALRRSPAGARYLVLCAALSTLTLAPCLTAGLLAHRGTTAAAHWNSAVQVASANAVDRPIEYPPSERQFAALPAAGPLSSPSAMPTSHTTLSPNAGSGVALSVLFEWLAPYGIERALPWLVLAWLAGVLMLAARLVGGYLHADRLRRGHTSAAGAEWEARLIRLARRMRVRCSVHLLESGYVQVPAVLGWLKPVILVPVGFLAGIPAWQVELLLAHELAHIRRYDYAVNIVQTVVETLLFYHPAVWWLSRQIRREREHCCDELVLATFENPLSYARALADLKEHRMTALALGAAGSPLLGRIRRILNRDGGPAGAGAARAARWLAGPLALAATLALALPVYFAAAEQPTPSQVPPTSTAPAVEADGRGKNELTGEEILQRMAKANQYWLLAMPPEVEKYSYDFTLGTKSPQRMEVTDPQHAGQAVRQAVTYSSVPHLLARTSGSAVISVLEAGADTIRLRFEFPAPIGVALGNGVSGSWQGYFSSRVESGTLVLDARRFVPLKLETSAVVEDYADFLELRPGQYVPQRIRVDRRGKMQWDWRFAVYEPGVWILESCQDAQETEPPPSVLARTSNVTINGRPAVRLSGSAAPVAQLPTSQAAAPRVLADGREKVEALLAANRDWLLPSLDARKGLVYEYRQEEPYRELIVFDEHGNLLAQLVSSKESPGVTTRQRLYASDGASVNCERTDALVRAEKSDRPAVGTGDAQRISDRRVRELATGLALDCALTQLARDPNAFGMTYEPSADGQTYKLMLRAPRHAALFSGTMLAFTSWAYMHDVRYTRSEIVVDARTNQPQEEKDYDQDKLVGAYTFADWISSPADHAGTAATGPGRIHGEIDWAAGERQANLQVDAEFTFVRPGVWLLQRVHSAFRDGKGESTGEVAVLDARPEHVAAVEEVIARRAATDGILKTASEAPASAIVPFRTGALLPAEVRAEWSPKADKAGESIIAIRSVRIEPASDGKYKLKIALVSTAYWTEYLVLIPMTLHDADGTQLADAAPEVRVRASNSPAVVEAECELQEGAGGRPPAELRLRATVQYVTARYHGHGTWMQLTRPGGEVQP